MKNSDMPPRWDLTSVYPSFESIAYKTEHKTCAALMEQLEIHLKNAQTLAVFADWLNTYFELANDCGARLSSLSSYTYCMYSTDTTNTAALNEVSRVEEALIRFSQIELIFRSILAKNAKNLPEIYKKIPKYEQYQYVFEQELIFEKKQMTPEAEKLAADLRRTGGNAWSRLQQQIIANLSDPLTGKTFNTLRSDAYDTEAQVRKTSFERETELLKQVKIPLAASLNSIKGETITLNKRVNWEPALEKSLTQSRLTKKSLNALINSIENSLPFWREYLNVKAKLLGKKKLPFYDLFAPLPHHGDTNTAQKNLVSRVWTFDEARIYIIEKFSAFSPELGSFANYAFANNWIDAEIRPGKVGGAYCTDFPRHKQTRILSNFSGSFSDITTLAHELGHAYHQFCVQDMDYALTHYPMTLAETASNFCETIIQKDVMQNGGGFDKIAMTEMHLQDSCQVLVDVLCRFYFERDVFEKRAEGELSADDFCTLMLDAQEKTYGSALIEKHPYMWAVKSHYYSPDLDFYNFPYAFGLLFASALYASFLKEGKSFAETYKALLRYTGSYSCEKVCALVGFNTESSSFWDSGMDLFKPELEALKTYERIRCAT